MNLKTMLLVSALAVSAHCAFAQSSKEDELVIDKGFAAMDENKDGSITKVEFKKYMTVYLAAQRSEFEKGFAALDADKDGKISRKEASANSALDASFEQIDEDQDGFVDKDDLRAAIKAAQEAPESK